MHIGPYAEPLPSPVPKEDFRINGMRLIFKTAILIHQSMHQGPYAAPPVPKEEHLFPSLLLSFQWGKGGF